MNLPVTEPFSIFVRVYYEDTDAGGIVYNSHYLNFMERARTEFLRSEGQDHQALLNEQRMLVVTEAVIRFKRPGRLDDLLKVTVEVESVGRVRAAFIQNIWLEDVLLCTGRIEIACLNSSTMRPAAITEPLRKKLVSVISLS